MKLLQFRFWFLLLYVLVLMGCGNPSGETTAHKVPPPQKPAETEQPAEKALSEPIVSLNLDEKNRALRGYDVVAYFQEKDAVPGKEELAFTWQGAQWWFSSSDNMEDFKGAPEKYAPSNGGFCTFGIVLGKKLDGDPEVWRIHDEKLYLFLNAAVREKFFQDDLGNIDRVNGNWPLIKDKSKEELN